MLSAYDKFYRVLIFLIRYTNAAVISPRRIATIIKQKTMKKTIPSVSPTPGAIVAVTVASL